MTVVKPYYYVTYYVATFCFSLDPFVVAFVDTMYTVDESMGSVSECLPQIDILDETVNVLVMDNSSSVISKVDENCLLQSTNPMKRAQKPHNIQMCT